MQPNGSQNYWQPQDSQRGTSTPAPPSAAPQQPSGAPMAPTVTAPTTESSPALTVTPHDEAFSPPKSETPTPVDEEHDEPPVLSWEASEYIDHEKDFLWYFGFALIVILALGISIWIQAWTFVALIVIMAVATIAYVRRPPRVMRYSLSGKGFHIGEQFHPYKEYRAFSVIHDGSFYAIMLLSTKRFMPATIIYFAEADGDDIVDAFGDHLPFEDRDLDLADRVIRRLRL